MLYPESLIKRDFENKRKANKKRIEKSMSEWKEYKLGEISDVQTGPFGSQLHKEQYVKNGTPIVTVEHLGNKQFSTTNLPCVTDADKDRLSKYIAYEGDVIFSRVGSVDRCSYVDKNTNGWLFSGRCLRVRPFTNICGEFLYYYFNLYATKQYIRNSAVGTTMPSINTTILSEVPISLPTYDTQRRIASILSSLDDKISVNKKICENLEAQAQALFKHWFIDFAPFKDGKFVESELGMIPEGWRVGKAEDFYSINIGKTPPRAQQQWFSESKNNNKIWISISDMGNCGAFISDSKEYLTPEAQNKFNIMMVPIGTILLSFKLTIGRVAIANEELTTNEAIARFILPSTEYREFTYLYLKQYKYGRLGSTSSIATAVNSKIIKSMLLLMPTTDVIKGFSSITSKLFDEIKTLTQESSRLSTLRDTLLPRLMSGEIKL